ncbi:MAG TPA: type II secretion system F family protein [Nakamurella sp.]
MNPGAAAAAQAAFDSGRIAFALVALAMALSLVPEVPRRTGLPHRPSVSLDPRVRVVVIPAGVLAACAVIAPGLWWAGLLLAVGTAAVLTAGRGRWPARGSPRRRAERRRWLIVHAELLASCLDSGLAMATALRAVGDVLGDEAGPRGRSWRDRPAPAGSGGEHDPLAALDSVAAMLTLGADTDTAWRAVDADEDLAPLAAAARRSAAGGTTLADAVREHAAQLRDEARQESTQSAGRAGVLMTAPLGVCFLPAFLCLGLAPVVLGLLGQLTIR